MAPHSSTLAWKIPWMEEPDGLQSVGSHRVGLSDFTFTFHFHALEKEMATHSSVLAWRIPGMEEPVGLPSMGSHGVGHDWSDLAAAAAVLIRRIFQMRENKNYIWSRFDKWTVFFKRSSSYHQQFKHFNLATQGFKYSLFDTMHSFGRKPMTGFLEKVKI